MAKEGEGGRGRAREGEGGIGIAMLGSGSDGLGRGGVARLPACLRRALAAAGSAQAAMQR